MNEAQPVPWYQSRTIITAIVMMAFTLLELSGVVPPEAKAVERIIDGLLACGAIAVIYLRIEPSAPKPLSQGQADKLTETAHDIVGR